MENLIFRNLNEEDFESIQKNIFTDLSVERVESMCLDFCGQMDSNSNWQYFCAEKDGEVLAFAIFERNERDSMRHDGNIFTVIVAPNFRRQKIATFMVNNILEYAKANDMTIVKCACLEDTAGDYLFKNLNFEVYGRLPKAVYSEDESVDEIYYYANLLVDDGGHKVDSTLEEKEVEQVETDDVENNIEERIDVETPHDEVENEAEDVKAEDEKEDEVVETTETENVETVEAENETKETTTEEVKVEEVKAEKTEVKDEKDINFEDLLNEVIDTENK